MTAFYYDIVCPYAYIAFSRLHREGLFAKKNIELKPILLGGLFKLMGQESDPNARMSQARARSIRDDILRQAALWSVPLSFYEARPRRSLLAMRLLTACEPDKREELTARLYKSYWQFGQSLEDEDFIAKLYREFGCSDMSVAKEALRKETAQAFEMGIFGVPTIAIDDRLYFGSDRLELIEERLGLARSYARWTKNPTPLDFYFDFSSPYSYLAQVEMQKAALAGQEIRHVPILLGALFKEYGLHDIPMLSAHPNKASYYMQDMADWARARDAPFNFNAHFPLRSVNALRAALVEPQAIPAIFAAAWAQNIDIGQEELLCRVLNEAGFLGPQTLSQAQALEIKEKLRANTARAFALGIFGVPTFLVAGQLIFGQDRFLWLTQELSKK